MAVELLLLLLKINLAVAAAVIIVLLARKPLRAAFGARVAYAAWLVVPLAALAVLVPAREVSFRPAAPTAIAVPTALSTPDIDGSVVAREAPLKATARATVRRWSEPIMLSWAAIALLCLGVQAARQRRFVRALGRLRPEAGPGGRLYRAEGMGLGPAVVGALWPKVVLPADFNERFTPEEQAVVVAHERSHLVAGDAQINALAALAQCLFWFNPLVHVAASALRVDQELACDAAVLTRFPQARRRYGEAMLKTQLAPLAPPLGCHWPARGKQQLLERLRMLGRERPGLARRTAGGALVAALGLGTGLAAWAAQPPRPPVIAEAARPAASPRAAALGADLLEALIQDDLTQARALIRAGADVNHRTLGDGTPLIIASRDGRSDIVDLLLARGADPNLASRGDGNPLIVAAGAGQLDIARRLVARGADVNGYVFLDETPLINAARTGDLPTVRYLVEQRANVNLAVPYDPDRPNARRSPLGEAIKHRHPEVAAYLKAKGSRA